MLSHGTHSFAPAAKGGLCSSRDVEFARALDRYMTSYDAEQQRRRRPRLNGVHPRLMRQLAASFIEALERLGGAMSSGGRSPAVGVM